MGAVEDEVHFLDVCPRWNKRRNEMWEKLRIGDGRVVGNVSGWDRSARVDWLLEGGCSVRTRAVVLRSLGEWLFARQKAGRGRPGSEGWGEGMRPQEAARIAGVVAERQARAMPRIIAAAAAAGTAASVAMGIAESKGKVRISRAVRPWMSKSGSGKSGRGKARGSKSGAGERKPSKCRASKGSLSKCAAGKFGPGKIGAGQIEVGSG